MSRPSPKVVVATARRAVSLLDMGAALYPLVAENAAHPDSGEGAGGVNPKGSHSDPTGTITMRAVCKACDGTTKRKRTVECLACKGRGRLISPIFDDDELVTCQPCNGTGRIFSYGPQDCSKCKGEGWEPTEQQREQIALDGFWQAVQALVRAVEGLARRAPEMAEALRTSNSDVATGRRKREGERFPAERKGFSCRLCGAVVPRIAKRLCIAYATDPLRRDPVTGKFLPSPEGLTEGCYDRWRAAYAREGIPLEDWVRREQAKRRERT